MRSDHNIIMSNPQRNIHLNFTKGTVESNSTPTVPGRVRPHPTPKNMHREVFHQNGQMNMLNCFARFVINTAISVLVVSYWRGLWLLQDFYGCVEPLAFCSASAAEHERSGAQSEAAGVVLALTAICTRHMLATCGSRDTPGARMMAVSQTLLLGASAVSLWRGCWYLTDAALLPTSAPAWQSH